MRNQRPATPIYKVILVNGDIRKATEQLDTRIYFDQEGVLSQNLLSLPFQRLYMRPPMASALQVDTYTLEQTP